MQVGINLIMWNQRMFRGLLLGFTDTYGYPMLGAAFANEPCCTGTGPDASPGNTITESGMFWGFGLPYEEWPNDTGGWCPTGKENYQFYCTTVYDGIQESEPQLFTMYPSGPQFDGTFNEDIYHNDMTYKDQAPKRFLEFADGTYSGADDEYPLGENRGVAVKMQFNPVIKWHGLEHDYAAGAYTTTWESKNPAYNFGAPTVGDTSGGNPRITAIRVYWASDEDGFVDLWQLMEWDFEKGVKAIGSVTGGSSYNRVDWTHPGSLDWPETAEEDFKAPLLYQHTHGRPNDGYGLEFKNPPRFLRYDAINGHGQDETLIIDSFKTSAIANGRVYAGNVKVDGIRYGDRMIKSGFSLAGPTPDKFPVKSNQIDVAIQDGDEIVKLVEFADRIFQFKKNVLYIINVSGATEFLESKHLFKGIPNSGAVCETDFGVAWANLHGCFLHDGKQVTNLLEPKGVKVITTPIWEDHIDTGAQLRVGFNPQKRQLIVKGGGDVEDAYIYDMITKSWVYASATLTDGNFGGALINAPSDGRLLMVADNDDKIYGWQEAAGNTAITIITRDIDFGEPAVRKNISKAYVTYSNGNVALGITYGVNGGVPDENFDVDYLSDTSGAIVEAELKPNGASTKSVKSFQIKIDGTADKDFVLHDISIVFRTKTVK